MVAEYEASGLSRQEFCLKQGLALVTLDRYRKRRRQISRATLDGWVMRVGELLVPIAAVMGRELVSGSYIQADETPPGVRTHDKRGKNHQAWLWQYSRPGGNVVFDFRLGRGREGPKRFLGKVLNVSSSLATDAAN